MSQHGTPQILDDLKQHQCICLKTPNTESVIAWEFRSPETQKTIKFSPQGRLVVNNASLYQKACTSGFGLIWIAQDRVAEQLARGELMEVLNEWAISYEGHHLYYPNRRQNSPLFKALVECLKV